MFIIFLFFTILFKKFSVPFCYNTSSIINQHFVITKEVVPYQVSDNESVQP